MTSDLVVNVWLEKWQPPAVFVALDFLDLV